MSVERLLQLHVAALAALGTLLLGMGQRNPVLPILVFFAAATSVYFTDKVKWFVLSRTFGNIAALAAVLFSSFEFWTIAADQQLLAIANLLVYLQIILLYQHKTSTRYWEISVLSLLQVVVAAALNLGFEFGVLLIVYMLTSFSALALFFIFREGEQFCAPEVSKEKVATGAAPAARRKSVRRQLLGDPVEVSCVLPASALASGLIGRDFLRSVGTLGAMTLIFSTVLFFSVPRTSNAVWQGQGEGASQTGFSNEVTLDEPGQIRQSEEIVMRVTFRQPGNEQPLRIAGEPYFYGTALTKYYKDQMGISRWKYAPTPTLLDPTLHTRGYRLASPPPGAEIVYQDTVVNLMGKPFLFSAPAVYAPHDMPDDVERETRLNWRSGQLSCRPNLDRRTFDYTVATTGFKGAWQLPVTQHQVRRDFIDDEGVRDELITERSKWLMDFDAEKFPQLIATAQKALSGVDPQAEPVVAARLLQDHFRSPGAYTYTLDFSKVPRAQGIDPIEDFVGNHRTGHCEYFASALCLMLRSQGIPARIVVGFKGGEYNSVGRYYCVRQLHAHAWVEAYLEKKDVPKGSIPLDLVDETGAWLRLDPTPASDGPGSLTVGVGMLARVGDAMDYMQLLWDDYILGLNNERQKKAIYNPLTDQAASMLGGVIDLTEWQARAEMIAERLGLSSRGEYFNWRGGVLASIIAAFSVGLYQAGAFGWRSLKARWKRQQHAVQRPRRIVEFYERLERLLADLDITRDEHQTQREFAVVAGVRLASLGPDADHLASLPQTIVDAFYRVRFGEAALDAAQAERIGAALDRLSTFVGTAKAP